jgi:hypothetical protein
MELNNNLRQESWMGSQLFELRQFDRNATARTYLRVFLALTVRRVVIRTVVI